MNTIYLSLSTTVGNGTVFRTHAVFYLDFGTKASKEGEPQSKNPLFNLKIYYPSQDLIRKGVNKKQLLIKNIDERNERIYPNI